MRALFGRLIADENGQDMAEYGLLLALIAVAIVAVIITLRDNIITAFSKASSALLK
jgi:pilus assembly protein Flp/PilA